MALGEVAREGGEGFGTGGGLDGVEPAGMGGFFPGAGFADNGEDGEGVFIRLPALAEKGEFGLENVVGREGFGG